jgi:hypothetical protein
MPAAWTSLAGRSDICGREDLSIVLAEEIARDRQAEARPRPPA